MVRADVGPVKFEFRTTVAPLRWHDRPMGTYHQYCPVARASEILAERWNPLIVRNLMFGADTFSAIARGVPTMSRSMLLKRLEELERAGVIESRRKPTGRGHLYGLTEAGADLAGVIDAVWRRGVSDGSRSRQSDRIPASRSGHGARCSWTVRRYLKAGWWSQ